MVAVSRRPGLSADHFVDTTLELIAAQGGSAGVNLREISRRLGCAHTNVYNYFASHEDLLWAAFARALQIYGEHLSGGLDDTLEPREYLTRVVTNLAIFPEQNPGLYRFVASDPINVARIPNDVMAVVVAMKEWLYAVVARVAPVRVDPGEAAAVANIVLAYVDGETLNLINGRVVPGEDVRGRVVANALRLFDLLIESEPVGREAAGGPPYPVLDLESRKGS
jgi:AcrR family transcriptional regulator